MQTGAARLRNYAFCGGGCVGLGFLGMLTEKKNLIDYIGFPVSGRHLGNKLKNLVYNCHLLMAKL